MCVGFLTNRIIDLRAASGLKLTSPSKSGESKKILICSLSRPGRQSNLYDYARVRVFEESLVSHAILRDGRLGGSPKRYRELRPCDQWPTAVFISLRRTGD